MFVSRKIPPAMKGRKIRKNENKKKRKEKLSLDYMNFGISLPS
jgi:hypothetical protein